MINVRAEQIGERFFTSVSGHALSAEKGKDLVCCAASTLAETLQFYMENLQDENKCSISTSEVQDGYFLLIVSGNSKDIKPAFDFFLTGIHALCDTFPQNICLVG